MGRHDRLILAMLYCTGMVYSGACKALFVMQCFCRENGMKLLLCSVFGPYGVDDEYGRRLNVMELFHNQVTREQGLYSLRVNHPSFGLYLIAENLETPTAVLDFPSLERFKQEVRKGYDYIGISFIVSNFIKAKKMAEIIRELSPHTKIILGGHGTGIPGIANMIDCDYVCKGEGVSWFRRLFKEDLDRPVRQPAILSTMQRHIMGIPLPGTAAVVIPGLGCVNACNFCATSHHFDKKYVGYMSTGKEVFETLLDLEKRTGYNEFFVMDENFLKHRPRAEELLVEMERHNKYFYLGVFSSAETIRAVGPEFMAKLGIDFVWVGVESKQSMFTKTQGVDLKGMIAELRSFGIQVLGSAILYLEHHTKENMQEDIDFAIDLETDFVQFMNLGPLPGTALYEEYEAAGRIRHDMPFSDWHGQEKIWFVHPHFTPEETPHYTKDAFLQDYRRQGPSLLRFADTALRGFRTVREHSSPRVRGLTARLRERCLSFRPLFPAARHFAENDKTRELVDMLVSEYRTEFGKEDLVTAATSAVVFCFAGAEQKRILQSGNMRQPPTRFAPYRMSLGDRLGLRWPARRLSERKA